MPSRNRPTRAGASRAALTIVAVIGSFSTMLAIGHVLDTGTQPALLAAILTLGIARRPDHARGFPIALYPLALAGVAVVASGVGLLLHTLPIVGALVFVGGIVSSIWLRNFGELERRVGASIALPLVTMLVVPVGPMHGRGGPVVDLIAIVAAGLVALVAVRMVGFVAPVLGISAPVAEPAAPTPVREPKAGALSVPTRMAIQMAVALALAFVAGFAFFAHHWGWTVLTAFIVCSGAIGRGDAAYKGVLRLIGALAGTACASALTVAWHPHGPPEAFGIFVALYLALWLRETSYAFWAAGMTLVLALLAQPQPSVTSAQLLELRLVAIFVGAICGVAACWFVVPIRTTDVVRRRLADALAALDAFLVAEAGRQPDVSDPRAQRLSDYARSMRALDRVATPVCVHRRLVRAADHAEHPGRWIDLARACHARANASAPATLSAEARTRLRRAIGSSRKAIGAHGRSGSDPQTCGITASLREVYALLDPGRASVAVASEAQRRTNTSRQ